MEAEHLGNLGIAYQDLGQFQQSRNCLSEALDLDVKSEDYALEQLHAGQLGLAYIGLGRYQESSAYLERALALATKAENRPAQGIHLGNLGLRLEVMSLSYCPTLYRARNQHKQNRNGPGGRS